ncbi:transposase [Streptomyces scopuliridis]|uniref:transposase n=1 Tax=Streptomyces scopuliridis TaxID=452529 RepID=UPI00398D1FB4
MDAVLCADGAVKSVVDLTLLPEHCRGHGAMYGGLNRGRIDIDRLRTVLAGLSLPRFDGGRLVLAVDVSPCFVRTRRARQSGCSATSTDGRRRRRSSFRAGPTPSSPCWSRAPRPGPRSWTRSGSARRTTRPRSPPSSCGVSWIGSSPRASGRPTTRTS